MCMTSVSISEAYEADASKDEERGIKKPEKFNSCHVISSGSFFKKRNITPFWHVAYPGKNYIVHI